LQPVEVPQEGDVEGGCEVAVAALTAGCSMLVDEEGQPELLIAAQGLFESVALAQATCQKEKDVQTGVVVNCVEGAEGDGAGACVGRGGGWGVGGGHLVWGG